MWKGKRILVTGGSGFVGSALCRRLEAEKAVVVSLAHGQLKQNSYETILADIRDRARITGILAAYRIELCFHLAAQPIGSIAKQDPVTTLETNVAGTWNVLEGCRILRIPVVYGSSDKCFGLAQPPYSEETTPIPAGIYETSKLMGDALCRSYAWTYNLPVAISRCANIYGGGDRNFTRIVPYTISQALRGEPVVIWGDGQSKRDYIYIDDVVQGYVVLAEALLANRMPPGEAFNFGTGKATSVLELVAIVNRLVGVDIEPVVQGKGTGEIKEQWLDSSKAQKVLGWEPQFSLEEGLKRTLKWYTENLGYV